MAALESVLGDLHVKVAEKLATMLDDPEELTPALIGQAIKFLKDNGIVCEVGDEEMDALAAQVDNVTKMPFVVGQD